LILLLVLATMLSAFLFFSSVTPTSELKVGAIYFQVSSALGSVVCSAFNARWTMFDPFGISSFSWHEPFLSLYNLFLLPMSFLLGTQRGPWDVK